MAAGSRGTDNVRVKGRKRDRRHPVHDIVTPTPHEQKLDEIAARRRRYFAIMLPCLALVIFGFWVPAPLPLRVGALVIASVMPPIAVIVGNAKFW